MADGAEEVVKGDGFLMTLFFDTLFNWPNGSDFLSTEANVFEMSI